MINSQRDSQGLYICMICLSSMINTSNNDIQDKNGGNLSVETLEDSVEVPRRRLRGGSPRRGLQRRMLWEVRI